MMQFILRLVVATLLCTATAVAQSYEDDFKQLKGEYTSSVNAWHKSYDDVETEAGKITRLREWPGWSFAPKFTTFAEGAGASQEAFDALAEVLAMGSSVGEFDRDLLKYYERAIELVQANHSDKALRTLCTKMGVSKRSEDFLRSLSTEGESKNLRAEACFRLGKLFTQRREMCLPGSWAKRTGVGAFGEYADSRTRENLDRFLADQDIEQLQSEATRYFETVISEYHDVLSMKGDEMLSVLALREIHELKHLAIGAVAPDISASDIDDIPMRLSAYRGKVVLLIFWASWCGPCISDIPHEKGLHTKFSGRPFAIVGVNADSDLGSARDSIEENLIPWRSFWNGKDGPAGPIATDWNVRGWPTVYIIDHKGIIRFKHLRREGLDEPLEQLIAEAEGSTLGCK